MRELIKYLSWINIIGFPTSIIILIIGLNNRPFAWGDLIIAFCILISTPFIISSIMALKNLKAPNKKQIQIVLISSFLILFFPSIALPFAYELGGLIICLIILSLGILGIVKIKKELDKLLFINLVSIPFLLLNFLIALGQF